MKKGESRGSKSLKVQVPDDDRLCLQPTEGHATGQLSVACNLSAIWLLAQSLHRYSAVVVLKCTVCLEASSGRGCRPAVIDGVSPPSLSIFITLTKSQSNHVN